MNVDWYVSLLFTYLLFYDLSLFSTGEIMGVIFKDSIGQK